MPHDAALFADSVKQRKSPAQTAAANATEVYNAQVEYGNSEAQAVRDYKVLSGQSPVKPTLTTFTPASVVMGSGTHSVAVVGTNFKAGMKIEWNGVLLTPTALTATSCTVTPTKSSTAKTVNVYAINYDDTLEARSDVKTFAYTATMMLNEPEPEVIPVPEESVIGVPDIPLDPTWTVDEVKQWVGGDHARAQEALYAEEAKETPRVTLMNWLTALLAT